MKSIARSNKMTRAGCALAGAVALLVAGCGGGGSTEPGTIPAINSAGPGSASNPGAAEGITLKLELSGAASATSSLAPGKPLTVTATVLDKAGKPVVNALLAFSVDPTLVQTNPAQGQLATDAAGKATIVLTPLGIFRSGASLLSVMAQSGAAVAQAQLTITVSDPKITLNQITPTANPALLQAYGATVVTLDALTDGALLSSIPVTVKLTSNCALLDRASLPDSVTTVAGRAQFTYTDKGCAQSDTIVATVDGTDAVVRVNLTAASPSATSIEVGEIVPASSSIVIQGAGGNGRSETALVRFKVLDKSGLPVSNQTVSFATISTKAVRLSHTGGTTDINGEVTANLISGTEPTAVRVVATLANGLSTVSDTITVTTGLPIQAAFSLSATEFSVEGFEYDDVTTDIKLLLADQHGNPVADGVPVVFQTDSGAIGTADRGGCTTVNGRCTVPWRSQNPRFGNDASAPQKRAGVATIQVSTLTASNVPLTGQISVFISGSHATNIEMIGAPAGVTYMNGTLSATSADCAAVSASLRLSDARRNPLPVKTSLLLEAAVKMTGVAYPNTVPSVAPRFINGVVSGDQGSVHAIAMVPDPSICEQGGPKTINASGLLTIKTPLGNTTTVPVRLSYRAKADAP